MFLEEEAVVNFYNSRLRCIFVLLYMKLSIVLILGEALFVCCIVLFLDWLIFVDICLPFETISIDL